MALNLTEFYRKTVHNNDNMIAGWATYYYGVLSKVINDNKFKKIAEVGIGYGTHAKQLLKTTELDTLYLIDPMRYYPNDGFVNDIIKCNPVIPNNHFNELFDLINNELQPWKTRWTWFRVGSLDITNEQIADNSLDCVFVDGDHSYDAVTKDLPFWWKKIRPGGKMLGDDYWISHVKSAVDEFALNIQIPTEFLTVENNDYKIFCFTKPDN